jgi:predicted transposase YdaD
LPLAPIAKVEKEMLPDVVRQMRTRIDNEIPKPDGSALLSAAFVLTGLRYPSDFVQHLFRGVKEMRESSTYQAIIEEGVAEGIAKGRAEGEIKAATEILVDLGRKRLGNPNDDVLSALDAIKSPERLETMAKSVLDVESWSELLAIPKPQE